MLRRNLDTNGLGAVVSMKQAYVKVHFPATSVGSPPEVFHSCGKKCGKAKVFGNLTLVHAEPTLKPWGESCKSALFY